MKVKEFEDAIAGRGLRPMEVRQRRGQVTWFVCLADGGKLCLFDEEGRCYLEDNKVWLADDIDGLTLCKKVGGLYVNGLPCKRDYEKDLWDGVSPSHRMENLWGLVKDYDRARNVLGEASDVIDQGCDELGIASHPIKMDLFDLLDRIEALRGKFALKRAWCKEEIERLERGCEDGPAKPTE